MVGIRLSKHEIRSFCQRYRIRKLALFGSVLRPDFGSESDIDVLVEFERGTKVGFFELYDMEQELSRILSGRKVDLNTPNSLSKYFRERALSEAQVEYVKAWYVDDNILWDTLSINLPELLSQLERILGRQE